MTAGRATGSATSCGSRSNGKLTRPADGVPADVTKLTAQFFIRAVFPSSPAAPIAAPLRLYPGTAGCSLPTAPALCSFTHAGTVDAPTSSVWRWQPPRKYTQQNKYAHSLFVADYAVTHTVSWDDLNTKSLIFGKDYAVGGVDYTLRAPSVGSNSAGSGDSQRGTPKSNEWDTMLNKNSEYIQNWNKMYSGGQDAFSGNASDRAVRGSYSARYWYVSYATDSLPFLGFRPVLEVLNPGHTGLWRTEGRYP